MLHEGCLYLRSNHQHKLLHLCFNQRVLLNFTVYLLHAVHFKFYFIVGNTQSWSISLFHYYQIDNSAFNHDLYEDKKSNCQGRIGARNLTKLIFLTIKIIKKFNYWTTGSTRVPWAHPWSRCCFNILSSIQYIFISL